MALLLNFLCYSFGGGTDVDRPLELSLQRLEDANWNQVRCDHPIAGPKAPNTVHTISIGELSTPHALAAQLQAAEAAEGACNCPCRSDARILDCQN